MFLNHCNVGIEDNCVINGVHGIFKELVLGYKKFQLMVGNHLHFTKLIFLDEWEILKCGNRG